MGLGPRDFDGFDACGGLGRLVPLDARFNDGPIAFEDRLDTSTPSVLDVPVKSQRLRLLGTVRSKVDPLHASEKDNDRADFHREAKRSSAKELYRGDGRFVQRSVYPRIRLSRGSGTGRRTFLIRQPAIALSPRRVLHEAEQGPGPPGVRLRVYRPPDREPGRDAPGRSRPDEVQ